MIISMEDFLKIKEMGKFYSKQISLTSIPGDVLHGGHIDCLRGSKIYNDVILVVLVNDDEFLMRKKGYYFLAHQERMRVIDAIKGVDYVVPWFEQNVAKAIYQIRPTYFCKGGDRSHIDNLDKDEVYACRMVDCELRLGVGGDTKTTSSSKIVADFLSRMGQAPGVFDPTNSKEYKLEGDKT
jgi:D-glycero-beta-D-manno-heptose 1-phosphate adenylyltransferase